MVASGKLFGSVRAKMWIAVGGTLLLIAGVLTRPVPVASTVAPAQERAAPFLEAEVERRQQLRIFEEIQLLGPRLARHSVTIPPAARVAPLPSDLTPPTPRVDPIGHGLIISADGEVLTSAAALRGRDVLDVELFDGRRVNAQVVAFDPDADLVLLRSDQVPRADAAPWATTPPRAGMLAVAVSHAAGQVAVAPVFVMAAPDAARRVRLTAADLSPGTPLFTTAGEVFAIASGRDDQSAALIAPAVARLRERIAGGQARRGALGLTFQPREGELANVFPDGVLVADVLPYGPADEAGVQPGDVITAIGQSNVATPEAAQQAISALSPHGMVTLQLDRDGKRVTVDATASSALTLRVRQAPRAGIANGAEARLLFDADARRASDLLDDSRILAVNGSRITSTDEARALLRRARGPLVLYIEDGRGRFFRVVERPR
jgi:S1-C subfamily serine protease